MKRLAVLAAAMLAAAAQGADAPTRGAPPAVVEAVQMRAWIERDGGRVPLAPRMALRSNDDLRTGANARRGRVPVHDRRARED